MKGIEQEAMCPLRRGQSAVSVVPATSPPKDICSRVYRDSKE